MTKNVFTLLLVIMMCISCDSIRYVHNIESTPYGIDFRNGKWLLNKIESPQIINKSLTKIAIEGFSKHLGHKLHYINDVKNIDLFYVPLNPDTLLLKGIKKDAQFDYFINIKGRVIKNEYNKIIAKTTLEIYNLNTLEIIYSREITGVHKIDYDDSRDVVFSKGVNSIIISSLRRIMKKIK